MTPFRYLPNLVWVPTVWLGLLHGGQARAEDGLQLSASVAQTQDSNLFRTDGAMVKTPTGLSSAAERIGTTTFGLGFHKAYSLQRVELDVSLVDYQYQNFDYLSFTAKNYTAAWRWSFTPRLRGNLTSSRKEALNSFSDYATNTLINQRNQRTDTNNGFDAIYELSGPWRLLAGMSQQKQVNQQALLTDSDFSANAAQLGARYEFASGSNLAYTFKASSGSYINRALSATNLYDDGYQQTDSDLRLRWLASGKVTANFNIGYVQRTHPNFSRRNYSGVNTGVNINWNLTGKTTLSAEWSRRLASYQTNDANYSQTDSLSVGPSWQISTKTFVGLRHEVAQVDYLGEPFGTVATPRQDTNRSTTLSLVWQPRQQATLSASLANTARSSSLPGNDYSSRQATLSANYSF